MQIHLKHTTHAHIIEAPNCTAKSTYANVSARVVLQQKDGLQTFCKQKKQSWSFKYTKPTPIADRWQNSADAPSVPCAIITAAVAVVWFLAFGMTVECIAERVPLIQAHRAVGFIDFLFHFCLASWLSKCFLFVQNNATPVV